MGSSLRQIQLEEHDSNKKAKRVSIVGTSVTEKQLPITAIASGNTTLLVPTTGTKFKVTHWDFGSNVTVTVQVLSGATYILGNASVGLTIFPGGGWVHDADADSPYFEGLANNAALVVRTDSTGVFGGYLKYFEE